jgi:predicted nuclease of restriction endonuclease-like RecB superfamily
VLPAEFLIVIRWKDNIRPKYSKLDKSDIITAKEIIKIYNENIGKKKSEIREKISEIEDVYGSYKFVRGLAILIERKCKFTSKSSFDPIKIRHLVFSEAAKRGFPKNEEERRKIIEEISKRFNISIEELEENLYSDLDSEMILQSSPEIDPIELLKSYNLSLTQTLLFYSTEMKFTVCRNWKNIFRAIKFYGLMHMISKINDEIWIRLDGPISLFKLTRRYGTSLAKIIPEIIKGSPWKIEAKILKSDKIFLFKIDSEKFGWIFPEISIEESYDSKIEKEFVNQFKSLNTPWKVERELEPIDVGNFVFIPDFTFKLGEEKILMEIVGFWTKDYLKRKIEKIQYVRDIPFIIAINEELACEKITHIKATNPNIYLIYYKEKIPIKEVLDILEKYAKKEIKKEAKKLKINLIDLKEDIINIEDLSAKFNVSSEVIIESCKDSKTHIPIGNTLIKLSILDKIKEKLEIIFENNNEVPLQEIIKIFNSYNIKNSIGVLNHLGYKIKWKGLENAIVQRPLCENRKEIS